MTALFGFEQPVGGFFNPRIIPGLPARGKPARMVFFP
jgi:hypothetical protein